MFAGRSFVAWLRMDSIRGLQIVTLTIETTNPSKTPTLNYGKSNI